MSRAVLRVDSTTGVEVRLPVAGAGGRSFAFIADWNIRVVLAVAWYVLATLVHNQRWSLAAPVAPHAAWFAAVLAPAFALYFLYHPVLEIAMGGRTPGKRIAGVRIVTTEGLPPAAGALLMRNVFRLIDGFPGLYCVGLATVLATRSHVRIGDLATGTLIVYERADLLAHAPRPPAPGAAPDPRLAELAAELLERWPLLTAAAREALARELLRRALPPLPAPDGPGAATALRAALERITGVAA